jgi:hypothetical protein
MAYTAGTTAQKSFKVQNTTTLGGVPSGASLRVQVSAVCNWGNILSPVSHTEIYAGGETKTFTQSFTIPAGYAGGSGQFIAQVFDPGGNELTYDIFSFSIDAPPPPPPPPPPRYTLSVAKTGSGTITKIPNLSSYEEWTTVNLTATPAVGWVFSYWDWLNGVDYDYYYDIYVYMDRNRSIRAVFEYTG